MRKYSQETINEIKRLYLDEKLSIPKIAKRLRISNPGVQKYISEDNLSRSFEEAWEIKLEQQLNFDFFKNINSEEKAYWLGMIYTDGCVYNDGNNNYKVSLGLKCNDRSHIERFATIFGKEVYDRPNNATGISIVEVSNKLLVESLWDKGIKSGKVYDESFELDQYIPEALIRHFIRGCFDGDGSIYKTKPTNIFQLNLSLVGNGYFLEWVSFLISSLFEIDLRTIQKKSGHCWEIHYQTHDAIKICSWFYKDSTIYLPRKRKIFDEYKQYRKTGLNCGA